MSKRVLGFLSLICLSLSGCGDVVQLAESILYEYSAANKHDKVPATPPVGWKAETFSYTGSDGQPATTQAWYSDAAGATAPTLVYFHGNAENLQSLAASNFLEVALEMNVNFVALDYPSYGRAIGKTDEPTFVDGGAMAIDWAKRNFPLSHVFVWGRSIGTGISFISTVAAQKGLSGLILTSPWTNFYDVALDKTSEAKKLPASWLANNNFDSKGAAPEIYIPVLIHHGTKDTTIPMKFGLELSKSFKPGVSVTFVPVAGRGHNDIFLEKSVWLDIEKFAHTH
jgi:uncharacterized protein